MAEQLQLVRRCDFATANISTVNLLSSSGLEVAVGGWQPQVIPTGESEVAEAMTFIVNGTSDPNLASTLGAIYQKALEVELSKQPNERYQVYLVDQLPGEFAARSAVVTSMEFVPGASLHDHFPVGNSHSWNGGQLALVRGHWEDSYLASGAGSVSSLGGTAWGSATPGDVPARLARFDFTTYGGAQTEIWWGFKTPRKVALANWFGLWELELGTMGSSTAATADATASNGTAIVCNFAGTSTMATRVTVTPVQLSAANYVDLRGSYRLIARMKVDAGYTCRVRSGYGLTAGTANLTYNEPVTVSATEWYLYDVGQVVLPAGGAGNFVNNGSAAMQNSLITLQAQLYAGTQGSATYWHADCFVAIPTDEGCGHIGNGAGTVCSVYMDALGRISAYSAANTEIPNTDGMSPADCVVPVGTTTGILAAQRAGSSVLADTISGQFYYFPRYLALRPGTA